MIKIKIVTNSCVECHNIYKDVNVSSAMLHETSSRSAQGWSVLNGITVSSATHTCYAHKSRAAHGSLHLETSTAVTHCLLIATHFTDPERMVTCAKFECHIRELNLGCWR